MAADWREDANCRDTDPEAFVLDVGASGQQLYYVPPEVVRVCARCTVAAECLRDAFDTGDEWTVRGGQSPRQRARATQGVTDAPAWHSSSLRVGKATREKVDQMLYGGWFPKEINTALGVSVRWVRARRAELGIPAPLNNRHRTAVERPGGLPVIAHHAA